MLLSARARANGLPKLVGVMTLYRARGFGIIDYVVEPFPIRVML